MRRTSRQSLRLASFASLALLSFGLLAACGPKPPVRTALQGSLAQLKQDIENAQRAGTLDRAKVVDLAQAVSERELASALGADGAQRVRNLRSCARPLRSAIARRAEGDDDVAAELTLILLETRAAERGPLLSRYLRSPSGAWRAVAARAAQRPIDSDVRRSFFADPDQRARRAAFESAREAHDPTELEDLLEAARLDPDPQAQSLAVRAVGAIGGERAVLALKDLWARADDPLRMAIVDAWSDHASFTAGGARELAIAAESRGGLAPVSASAALSRAGGGESETANARLRRFLTDGTEDEKRLALGMAPLDAETQAALLQLARGSNPELRIAAWARLRQLPEHHKESLLALRALANAKPGSDTEKRAQAAAIVALADAGDTSVAESVKSGVKDKDLQTRERSARALLALGDYGNAATALADDDANLRTGLSCTILARESRRER